MHWEWNYKSTKLVKSENVIGVTKVPTGCEEKMNVVHRFIRENSNGLYRFQDDELELTVQGSSR